MCKEQFIKLAKVKAGTEIILRRGGSRKIFTNRFNPRLMCAVNARRLAQIKSVNVLRPNILFLYSHLGSKSNILLNLIFESFYYHKLN